MWYRFEIYGSNRFFNTNNVTGGAYARKFSPTVTRPHAVSRRGQRTFDGCSTNGQLSGVLKTDDAFTTRDRVPAGQAAYVWQPFQDRQGRFSSSKQTYKYRSADTDSTHLCSEWWSTKRTWTRWERCAAVEGVRAASAGRRRLAPGLRSAKPVPCRTTSSPAGLPSLQTLHCLRPRPPRPRRPPRLALPRRPPRPRPWPRCRPCRPSCRVAPPRPYRLHPRIYRQDDRLRFVRWPRSTFLYAENAKI